MRNLREGLALHTFLLAYPFLSLTASQGVQTIVGLAPGDVAIATRQSWCTTEVATCNQLCVSLGSDTDNSGNTCDYNSLSYLCECLDGSTPAINQFQNSIATLACNYQLGNCLSNATASASAQKACRITYVCGTLSPGTDVSVSQPSSTSSATQGTSTTNPSQTSDTTTNTITPQQTSHSTTAWLAGPIIAALLLISATLITLLLLRRRRRKQLALAASAKHDISRSSSGSTSMLWAKAELDGVEGRTSMRLYADHPQIFEMSSTEALVELEGSPVPELGARGGWRDSWRSSWRRSFGRIGHEGDPRALGQRTSRPAPDRDGQTRPDSWDDGHDELDEAAPATLAPMSPAALLRSNAYRTTGLPPTPVSPMSPLGRL